MNRAIVAVQIVNATGGSATPMLFAEGRKWRSAVDNFLPLHEGLWEVGAGAGVVLTDVNGKHVATLNTLVFKTCRIGDSGAATFETPGQGGVGTWTVKDTTDL